MKLSEKYFAKHFDKVINCEGCVIADPAEIKTYGAIRALEELDMYVSIHGIRKDMNEPTQFLIKEHQQKITKELGEIAKREKL